MKPLSTYLTNILGVLIALLVGIMLSLNAWEWFKRPGLEFKNLPWAVSTDSVDRGSPIFVKFDMCSSHKRLVIYEIIKGVKNSITDESYMLQAVRMPVYTGCVNTVNVVYTIPKDLPPGPYTMFGVGTIPDVVTDTPVAFYSVPFIVN